MTQRDRFGRKRAGKAKRRISSLSPSELWHQGEYLLFFALSTALFLLVGIVLLTLVATGGWIIGGLASVLLFVWVVSAVDFDTIKDFGGALWGSGSAEWLKSKWDSCLPHRNRRGTTSVRTLFLLGLVVTSLVVSTMAAGQVAAAGAPAQEDCSTEIVHDAFRQDSAVSEFNDTGSTESRESNTRVNISETDAFYRVEAENPNGYCVELTIRVSEGIMPATERGEVTSTGGDVTAEWHDITNFDSQETYTEITVTVPAGTGVTFAPSKPAVIVPSWRDDQAQQAQGIIERVRNFSPFEDNDLEQREYEFSAPDTNGSYVNVPLENESTNSSIDDYRAVYRTSEDGPWRPVTNDADAPVFIRELDGTLQFVFNDKDAEVKLTANPSHTDKMKYEIRSWRSSLADLKSLNIFGHVDPGVSLAALPATGSIIGRDS